MKKKNVKFQPANLLATVSLKIGKISAEGACIYIYHQPKMPDQLKTLKNK